MKLGHMRIRFRGYHNHAALHILVTACAITFGVVFAHILRPDLYSYIENKMYDILLKQAAPHQIKNTSPVLIAIDDKALAQVGQWPWPRHHLAQLIDRLHQAQASVIILDVILASPDRTSPLAFRTDYPYQPCTDMPLDQAALAKQDHDYILAQSLQKNTVILGYKLLFTTIHQDTVPETILPALPLSLPPAYTPYIAQDLYTPLAIHAASAQGLGFINALPDADGIQRRVPLLATFQGQVLPSLVLASVLAHDHPALSLGQDIDGCFIQFNEKRIYTDPHGNVLLRYRGPRGTFPTYSAADILAAPLPDLQGRIVIIGPVAAGLGDNHIAPMDRVFPGIEIHATLLDNILHQDALIQPMWASGAEVCMALIVGLLSGLLILTTGTFICTVGFIGGVSGLWFASLALLDGPGYWLSPLAAEITLILNIAILSLMKYSMEERELRVRTQQLVEAQDATILSLTALAETRDPETGDHIKRTREYVLVLAQNLARKPRYRAELDEETIVLLHKSAPLHDIGKVGISDSILLKPGRLTPEEWQEMQRHTILGAQTLAEAERLAFNNAERSFLGVAKSIALAHHEKWDGSGYPYGLRGEDIPLGGRLMALADVYDALISKRVYKDAMPHEEAVEIIRAGYGTHFDPAVVDAFLESEDKFAHIAELYS